MILRNILKLFTAIVLILCVGQVLAGGVQYGYDAMGRVTQIDYGSGNVVQYTYDAVGNRVALVVNGTINPGNTPILSVTPHSIQIPWTQTADSCLVGNVGGGTLSWSAAVVTGTGWLSIASGESGTNGGAVKFLAQANGDTIQRFGSIRIQASGALGSPVDISIVQGARPSSSVWLVKPDGTGRRPTIQAAIDAAVNGDIILLADGVFKGTGNRNIEFKGKRVTVCSQSHDPLLCTIDVGGAVGDQARAFVFAAGEDSTSRVEYVSMINGFGQGEGGAIGCWASSPMIVGCVLQNNVASCLGGALYFENCQPTVRGCIIKNNSSGFGGDTGLGGAIHMTVRTGCHVLNNTFEGNRATKGGAIYIFGDSDTTLIEGNVFRNNKSTDHGAAIWIRKYGTVVRRNIFVNNSATPEGHSVIFVEAHESEAAPTIQENTFAYNTGTALWFEADIQASVEGNIFAYSESLGVCCQPGGTVKPLMSCNVLWGNIAGNEICGSDGGGNFWRNPLFCDPSHGILTLAANSPCLPGNHPSGCSFGQIGALGQGCSDIITDVPPAVPEVYALHQNVPNPFNPVTTIAYDLPKACTVSLRIYDVKGELVRALVDERQDIGMKQVVWDGRDNRGHAVASGVYFYRLAAGSFAGTRKMVLLR